MVKVGCDSLLVHSFACSLSGRTRSPPVGFQSQIELIYEHSSAVLRDLKVELVAFGTAAGVRLGAKGELLVVLVHVWRDVRLLVF